MRRWSWSCAGAGWSVSEGGGGGHHLALLEDDGIEESERPWIDHLASVRTSDRVKAQGLVKELSSQSLSV